MTVAAVSTAVQPTAVSVRVTARVKEVAAAVNSQSSQQEMKSIGRLKRRHIRLFRHWLFARKQRLES